MAWDVMTLEVPRLLEQLQATGPGHRWVKVYRLAISPVTGECLLAAVRWPRLAAAEWVLTEPHNVRGSSAQD